MARAALSQGQVQVLWQAQHFSKVKHRFGGRRSIFARSTFAAGARKSQLLSTKVVREVNFRSWNLKIATFKYESSAQSPLSQPTSKVVRKVHFRSWGSKIFARSSIDFVAGAALSQGQVPNSWQAQHFRKVKYKIRGRRITFARSSTEIVAGAALSQGQVQNSWHAQHFRKVKCRFCGRRSTLARSTFAAGARKSQLLSTKVAREVNFRSWGLKIAT